MGFMSSHLTLWGIVGYTHFRTQQEEGLSFFCECVKVLSRYSRTSEYLKFSDSWDRT